MKQQKENVTDRNGLIENTKMLEKKVIERFIGRATMKQNTEQLKKIEGIKDKCLKLTGGKINEDFWGYVFGSLIDYGHAHGGLMSHKAFMEAIEIANLLTKTTPSHDEIKREAVIGFVEYYMRQQWNMTQGIRAHSDMSMVDFINEYLTQSKEGGK